MALIVAIDGPAGAGKSTVSQRAAEALGFTLVDTGAIYRCVGLAAERAGLAPEDAAGVGALASSLSIRFSFEAGVNEVFLNDERVSAAIRTPEVSQWASRVSALGPVRDALLELQRSLGRAHPAGAVLEGRDIGTVVFPDAELKVFLTAGIDERARRRVEQLAAKGEIADLQTIKASIAERDARDMGRAQAPLRRADDAKELITDGMTIDAVVQTIAAWARAVGA
jgi:cytidylate kinase